MEDMGKITIYKNLVEQMLCQVHTKENLRRMKEVIKEKEKFEKRYSRGGEMMPRGYYCPSLIKEIIVTNVTRGKLLKRLTKKSLPDYCYYFDEGKIILVQSNFSDEERFQSYEWIDRQGDTEYSLKANEGRIFEIIISKFDGGRIVSNNFLCYYTDTNHFELVLEEYQYDHVNKLISAVMTKVSVFDMNFYEDIYHFDFQYDLDGSLVKCIINGDESEEDPVRIPPIVRELITGEPQLAKRKALTETELSREFKKVVKECKGEDIYAISVFINHDGDEVTEFAVGCNLEENQKGEERWNYACWDQDEESLMYLLDEKEADWKKLLDLCAKSVSKLQEKQFFNKLFGREIPVIIHGYEYTEEDLEATRLANPAGQADEFFETMKDLGIIE